jgi:hypothetical protein
VRTCIFTRFSSSLLSSQHNSAPFEAILRLSCLADASGRAIGALASLGTMPGRTIQSFLEADWDSPMDEKKGAIMSVARRSSRRLESKTASKTIYDSKRSSDEDYAQNFGDDDESEESENFQSKTSHTFAVGKTPGGAGPQRPPVGLYTGTAASSDISDNEESLRVGIKPKVGGRSKAPLSRKPPAPQTTYGSSMSISMVEAMYANRTADLQAIDRDTEDVDSEFAAINSQLVKLMQGHASTRRDLVIVLQSLREVAKKWPNELRRVNVDPNQLNAALALVPDSGPDFDASLPFGGKHAGPNALIQALHDVKLSNRTMPTPTAAGSWQQDYLMLYPQSSYMADVAAHGIYVQPAALPIDTPHAGDHASAGRKRGYSEVATQNSNSQFPEGDSGAFTPGSAAPVLDARPSTGESKRARLDDVRGVPAPSISSSSSNNDAFSRPPGLNTDLLQPEPMGSMGLTPALALHSTNDQDFTVPLSKPLLPDLLPVSETAGWRPYMVATHMHPQFMSGYGQPLTMQHMNMLMEGDRSPEGRSSGAGAFPSRTRPSYMYMPQYAHTPSAGMGMQASSQFMGTLGVPVAPIYTTMPAKISMSMTSPLSPNTTTHAASNGMSSDSHILTNTSSSAAGLTVAPLSTPSNGMQMQTI